MKIVIRMTNSVGGELSRRVLTVTDAEDETAGMLFADTLVAMVRDCGRLCVGDSFTITEEA